MLVIALVMLLILVLCALVGTYVAYPHRGEEVPAASWLGEAMAKAAAAAPTLSTEGDPSHGTHAAEQDAHPLL